MVFYVYVCSIVLWQCLLEERKEDMKKLLSILLVLALVLTLVSGAFAFAAEESEIIPVADSAEEPAAPEAPAAPKADAPAPAKTDAPAADALRIHFAAIRA